MFYRKPLYYLVFLRAIERFPVPIWHRATRNYVIFANTPVQRAQRQSQEPSGYSVARRLLQRAHNLLALNVG